MLLARHAPCPEQRVSVHWPSPAQWRTLQVLPPQPVSQTHMPGSPLDLPGTHFPWWEQSSSHGECSQAAPSWPGGQWQWPDWQSPTPPQIWPPWDGQTLVSQPTPLYPASQTHERTPVRGSTAQSPWPPQRQSVSAHVGPAHPGSHVHALSTTE